MLFHMTLVERVTQDLTAAMKSQDAGRTSALRMAKAALKNREIEKKGDLDDAEVQSLTEALTYYGARFIPEDENGGVGVRRKFTRTKVKMIDRWESEGGPVREDDV